MSVPLVLVEIFGELLALVLQALSEVCCEALLIGLTQALLGVSAYKVQRGRVVGDSRRPAAAFWVWTFWILLPIVVGLTGLLIWRLGRH